MPSINLDGIYYLINWRKNYHHCYNAKKNDKEIGVVSFEVKGKE